VFEAELQQAAQLKIAGRLKEAAGICGRILQRDPACAPAWHQLGLVAQKRRDTENAERFMRQAVNLEPANPVFRHALGMVLSFHGRFDEAESLYREAIRLNPDFIEAYFDLSVIVKGAPDDPILGEMERLTRDPRLQGEAACLIHFGLGKLYDDLGDFDRAFQRFKAGNAAKPVRFDREAAELLLQDTKELFSRDFFEARRGLGSASGRPVFVVGMPRSGTTLAERVLASHPMIYGAGERPDIAAIKNSLAKQIPDGTRYPCFLPHLAKDTFHKFADAYLAQVAAPAPEAERVVDKEPLNFRHLGLIALMFPGARIVHCQRSPLDTCLSCYFQNFLSGQEFSFDLTNLGVFYRNYREMMTHWKAVLSVEILEVRYEDLVADQTAVGREMIAFCGLEWDDACARPHENERAVRTASLWQARQPVYRTSVARWRNYRAHLGPLIEALGPLAADAAVEEA